MKTQVAHLLHRSVRYLESGSGRPLLLLHAFPLSADQWLPQLHRVPPGWRFIAPDLRGFRGMGPAFEDLGLSGLTIDDYADDVLDLMTHLEIEEAAVAGLSMGGYVAFAMLRRASKRVSALVLSNTRAIADSPQAKAARAASITLAEREGAAGIALEMAPRLLGDTTRRGQPDLEEAVKRLILVNAPDAIIAALGALRDRPDSTSLLSSIAVSTLVIAGDEDAIVNITESRNMQEAIPGSTLVTLPRTGHLGNLEAPGPWSTAVDTFLTGL